MHRLFWTLKTSILGVCNYLLLKVGAGCTDFCSVFLHLSLRLKWFIRLFCFAVASAAWPQSHKEPRCFLVLRSDLLCLILSFSTLIYVWGINAKCTFSACPGGISGLPGSFWGHFSNHSFSWKHTGKLHDPDGRAPSWSLVGLNSFGFRRTVSHQEDWN